MIKLGINGFGRIGRMVFRAAVKNFGNDIQVVGINDLLDADYLAYMLRYDSVHGQFDGTIEVEGNNLVVNGNKIRLTAEMDPANLKWDEVGAEVVVESTGFFLTDETARKHITAGAKKVIMSAPSKDATPMFVYGVNHETYAGQDIISNASCTTNCLAPVAYVLDKEFGIEQGFMTTIHSYTNDQKILDQVHKDLYRSRAAAMSMIPTSTGAAKAVGLVLPQLAGKLDGVSIRVPTPDVSIVDANLIMKRPVTKEEVNAVMKKYSETELKGILGYNELPLVSIDFTHNPHSSTFDANGTKVMGGTQLRVMSWYDNEWGFSNRMLDTAAYMGGLIK